MAEFVQLHAEKSLTELEELKRVKLFTENEVRKVRKMRNNFEYKLARAHKTKESFLKYIQYEISLLNLIKIRREKEGYDFKKKEIDSQIGKRINNLFKLVIKKFPEDTQLWLSHREFLKKMKWNENMSGMLSRMLQIHNRNPDLWVTVAKWELEDNKACDTARQVLHRGLRFHPESKHIWQEYFRMELIYADQLRKRRNVLGMADVEDDMSDDVVNGKVALIAFNEAMKSVPDANFAISFIPICKEFDFTQFHLTTILNFIKENFQNKEETWNALARCKIKNSESSGGLKNQAGEIFEQGVSLLPTEKMWSFYLQFILDKIKDSQSERNAVKLVKKVLELFQRALDCNSLSKEMFLEWILMLNSVGDEVEARRLSVKATTIFPTNVDVWQCCLRSHITSDVDRSFFMILFRKAAAKVADKDSIPLWELALDCLSVGSKKDIVELFELGLTQGPSTCKFIKLAYLQYSNFLNKFEATQELYLRLSSLQPLSEELFLRMAQYESYQMHVNAGNIRCCYENCIVHFGEASIDCWISYAKFELRNPNGQPSKIGSIYSRAIKTLKKERIDEFIRQYTEMIN